MVVTAKIHILPHTARHIVTKKLTYAATMRGICQRYPWHLPTISVAFANDVCGICHRSVCHSFFDPLVHRMFLSIETNTHLYNAATVCGKRLSVFFFINLT
jgi:hypothetical protein